MGKSEKHYFAVSNSGKGQYSFLDSNLQDIKNIYVLQGGSFSVKSTFLNAILMKLKYEDLEVDCIHHPIDHSLLNGIILPKNQAAIIDETDINPIHSKVCTYLKGYIDLNSTLKTKKIQKNKEKLFWLKRSLSAPLEENYWHFANALRILDQWKQYYMKHLDYSKVDSLSKKTADLIFKNYNIEKKGTIKHRFLGTTTAEGWVDFIPALTESLTKRFFIEGRPGTGKSSLLKNIAYTGQDKGYDVEYHHCGINPQDLDMVILPELSIAIFDCTAPHAYTPSKRTDEIIDLYSYAFNEPVDILYENELDLLQDDYIETINNGIQSLQVAKEYMDEMNILYKDALSMDELKKLEESMYKTLRETHSIPN